MPGSLTGFLHLESPPRKHRRNMAPGSPQSVAVGRLMVRVGQLQQMAKGYGKQHRDELHAEPDAP